ncbi:hypothetical protein NYE33_15955 [Paenibacillus sp. FSL R10-2199]
MPVTGGVRAGAVGAGDWRGAGGGELGGECGRSVIGAGDDEAY